MGTGLTSALVRELSQRFAGRTCKAPPFAEKPPIHRPTTWVKPEQIAEVSFADWTPDGLLREPVLLRLRSDLKPADIKRGPGARRRSTTKKTPSPASAIELVLQQLDRAGKTLELAVGGARVRITNLDRVYWPADKTAKQPPITKRDLLRYLARVSPFMLPHLKDRPLTMIRMPEGIHGERFFQKHWDAARPDFVETVTVSVEEAFWHALKEIADARGLSLNALVGEIDRARSGNLSSAIRVFVLAEAQRGR